MNKDQIIEFLNIHFTITPDISKVKEGTIYNYFFNKDSTKLVWISIDPDGDAGVLFSNRTDSTRKSEDFRFTPEYILCLEHRITEFLEL